MRSDRSTGDRLSGLGPGPSEFKVIFDNRGVSRVRQWDGSPAELRAPRTLRNMNQDRGGFGNAQRTNTTIGERLAITGAR